MKFVWWLVGKSCQILAPSWTVAHQAPPSMGFSRQESSLQFSRLVVSDSLQPHGLQHARLPCPSPAPSVSSNYVHQISDTIQPSHPLLSPSPPAFNFPSIGVFSSESALHIRWPKYWDFSFSISPSNEYSGLISFRMDWLDLLAVQGTLQSLLQHHSSKASILWCSAFFMVQLSHRYMTTGKTIALTRWTFVSKIMSLLFNMLSRLVFGEGNGTPLQYSCLENPMGGGAW